MQDANQQAPSPVGVGKLRTFAREHPALTAIGLGGIGLFAGVELASGMLIGAGITALLRRQPGHDHHTLREKSRAAAARVPHAMRERARAVFEAARGKTPHASTVEAPFA